MKINIQNIVDHYEKLVKQKYLVNMKEFASVLVYFELKKEFLCTTL
jgi:hypothetical protein